MTLNKGVVYIVNTQNCTKQQQGFLYNFCDDYIKQKVDNLRLIDNQKIVNTIVGCVLRKYLVKKYFNIELKDQVVALNKFHKPFFKGKKIYFNVSHSCSMVACAVSVYPVGIDIEKIHKYNKSMADYLFCEEEINSITKSIDKDLEFSKLWVIKESKLKLKGCGFVGYMKEPEKNIETDVSVIGDYVVGVSRYKNRAY